DRSPVRALSILLRSCVRTRSRVRLAQCDDRAVPTETAIAPDKRTTKRGSPGKRHLSRPDAFAIPAAEPVADGGGASFRAKDSVLPAPEAVQFQRSQWGWSEFPRPSGAVHSRS